MLCPKCRSDNLDYARFCKECGTELAAVIDMSEKQATDRKEISTSKPKISKPMVMVIAVSALVLVFLILILINSLSDNQELITLDKGSIAVPNEQRNEQTTVIHNEAIHAEFINFKATRRTNIAIEGDEVKETIESFELTEFELMDGSIVGMATIELDDGTHAIAIIEGHLLNKDFSGKQAEIVPIETILLEGETVKWKVIALVK